MRYRICLLLLIFSLTSACRAQKNVIEPIEYADTFVIVNTQGDTIIEDLLSGTSIREFINLIGCDKDKINFICRGRYTNCKLKIPYLNGIVLYVYPAYTVGNRGVWNFYEDEHPKLVDVSDLFISGLQVDTIDGKLLTTEVTFEKSDTVVRIKKTW